MQRGSVRNKIVASEIAQERARCDFDQRELGVILVGGEDTYNWLTTMYDDFGKHPELSNNLKYYEMTGEE